MDDEMKDSEMEDEMKDFDEFQLQYFKFAMRLMFKHWKTTLRWIFKRAKRFEITVETLFDRINSNLPPIMVDVRTALEFNGAEGHIPNSKLVPVTELTTNEDLQSFKEQQIVTICPGGGMSLVAVDIMTEAGFKDVKSLKGGLWRWKKKGYPITRS